MKTELHYFSPTKGGEKIAKAIARGLEGDDKSDITPAVFVTPVYSGHMPEPAKKQFENIKAKSNQPAILVAVYGNRAFECALTDLETFVKERGYRPVAAAVFVCEHSYSTPETPIAAGRPDQADLQEAEQLGEAIKLKLLLGDLSPINAAQLKDDPVPEEQAKKFMEAVAAAKAKATNQGRKPVPQYHGEKCTRCEACVTACPVEAIGEDLSLDSSRCIVCCACVKVCPTGARTFRSPLAKALAESFPQRKPNHYVF